jgi:class 3 adenylate cyclase
MTLVERFIDFQDWPTSRKTTLAAVAGSVGNLWILVIALLFQSTAVDLAMVVSIVLGASVHLAAMAAISWFVYRHGHAGRWTAPATLFPFITAVLISVLAFGIYTSPFLALVLLLPPFSAIWFDIRTAVHLVAYITVLLVVGGVLTLIDVIPFAPAMEVRDIDGLKTVSWFIVVPLTLLPIAVLVWAMVFVAVAAANLQSRRLAVAHTLLRRYVPEQVADAVLSDAPDAIERHERRKLTIFFSDLVGFTDLSDEMEPEDLATVLHEYFTEMSAIARRHGGTVDDLVGDAILVLFGAPTSTDDHDQALRAVRMAVEMQEAMGPLNERWAAAGIPETLQVRMGVNTGVATVGNFGSAERTKYTALGKQVNVAARIQSQCEPGNVLLGHTTWLLVRDDIPCTPKGELVLKGLRKPMPVYEVEA